MYTRSTAEAPNAAPLPSSPLPIGAIAGAVAAGVLLAVVVTLGWIQWGKRRNRLQPQLRWGEAEAKPKQDMVHHAALSEPRSPSQEPFFPHPMDRKIQFETRSDDPESGASSTIDGLPEVSKPRPLRSAKTSSRSLLGARDRYLAMGRPISPKIAHKPSTVSSISMYSTASGEEHQVRVPPNLILAATGGLGIDTGGDRHSATSSNWSFLSRMAPGVQGSATRYSQASSQTAYTALSRDSAGVPVGVAL
ncbi:hypothetical protein C0991_003746 [Blastosporella zonata]|nr:hypothetical protein C0991_003746 [Blastosporella zonata]